MRQNTPKVNYACAFLSILMLFWPLEIFAQQLRPTEQPYPIKNTAASIQEAYANVTQWDGRAVSIEGTVKSIVMSAMGQPRLELVVEGHNATSIWAIWALTDTSGMGSFLTPGEKLKVFGWMVNAVFWSKSLQLDLPRQTPMILLSACLVKARDLDAVFDSKSARYCEAWRKGHMPPDMNMGR